MLIKTAWWEAPSHCEFEQNVGSKKADWYDGKKLTGMIKEIAVFVF